MFKQKRSAISDLANEKPTAASLTVVAQHNRRVAGETGMGRGRQLRYPNRGERITRETGGVEANSEPVQLTTLSKVVDRAFTGWTIKTQK